MLPDAVREAILVEIHRAIAEEASEVVNALGSPSPIMYVFYPSDETFTAEQERALQDLQLSPAARSGLLMLIKQAASHVAYRFFTIVDGIAGLPKDLNGKRIFDEYWPGLRISLGAEEVSETHQDPWGIAYGEAYWAYKKSLSNESESRG